MEEENSAQLASLVTSLKAERDAARRQLQAIQAGRELRRAQRDLRAACGEADDGQQLKSDSPVAAASPSQNGPFTNRTNKPESTESVPALKPLTAISSQSPLQPPSNQTRLAKEAPTQISSTLKDDPKENSPSTKFVFSFPCRSMTGANSHGSFFAAHVQFPADAATSKSRPNHRYATLNMAATSNDSTVPANTAYEAATSKGQTCQFSCSSPRQVSTKVRNEVLTQTPADVSISALACSSSSTASEAVSGYKINRGSKASKQKISSSNPKANTLSATALKTVDGYETNKVSPASRGKVNSSSSVKADTLPQTASEADVNRMSDDMHTVPSLSIATAEKSCSPEDMDAVNLAADTDDWGDWAMPSVAERHTKGKLTAASGYALVRLPNDFCLLVVQLLW